MPEGGASGQSPRSRERAAQDQRRAAEETAAAVRRKQQQVEDARAEPDAARARRHQIAEEMLQIDRRIRTLRERRMIRLTPGSGLSAQGTYDYLSELKAAEDVERERKRKLEEERDGLATGR